MGQKFGLSFCWGLVLFLLLDSLEVIYNDCSYLAICLEMEGHVASLGSGGMQAGNWDISPEGGLELLQGVFSGFQQRQECKL